MGGALLAALLVGSLLAVGGLASAANTAIEGNVADDERRIAGANRYATAVNIAELAIEAGADIPSEVLVVSGVGWVEAVSVAAVSAEREAPVLLTDPDRLPSVVRKFIRKHEVQEVTIVGGPQAVSEDVAESLAGLDSVEVVTRIAGGDRYDTAVEVAEALDVPGSWCEGSGAAVILVNGESPVDGVAVSPAAYAMQVPVLFSLADELHPAVADYLEAAAIDEAVLLGSEAELGSNLVDALEDADVEVTRITGDDVHVRSVALAAALANCEGVTVAANQFAFLDAGVPVDGVTAAGLLADGAGQELADGLVVPVLLVAADLPASISTFLSAIPARRGSVYQNVVLHALGGTSRITPELMAAALSAAVTSEPITATIAAKAGASTFTVRFSAPVDEASATARSNYRLLGNPLIAGDTLALEGQTVTVTLNGDELRAGDVVAVVGGKVRGAGSGAQADLRMAVGTSFTVPTPARDVTRPKVTVVAPPGGSVAFVQVEEANPAAATDPGDATAISDGLNASEVTLTVGGQTLEVDVNNTAAPNPDGIRVVEVNPNSYEVFWGCTGTGGETEGSDTSSQCVGTALSAGDRIRIASGAIVDAAGNASRSASATVQAEAENIALSGSPTITAPMPGVDVDDNPTNGLANITVAGVQLVQLAVRPGSPYTGVGSAGWIVRTSYVADSDDPAVDSDNDEPKVTVDVNDRRGVISITIDDDATVPDLTAALQSHEGLTASFAVTQLANEPAQLDNPIGGDGFADGTIVTEFTGGLAASVLTLRFRDPAATFDLDAFFAAQADISPLNSAASQVASAAFVAGQTFPSTEVRILYVFNAPPLPGTSQLLNLPAGVATNSGGSSGPNLARTNVKVRTIAGVALEVEVDRRQPVVDQRRPEPPAPNPFDRSTFTKGTSIADIEAEAAHSRAQNVYDLAIAYFEGTAGQVEPGRWQGLSGLAIDTAGCDTRDPTWNSKGVTATEIRLGLSIQQTRGPGMSHHYSNFALGWEEYFKYVNENDPIIVDGTERNLTAVVHDHGGNRNLAYGQQLAGDNLLGATLFDERREQWFATDNEEYLTNRCVPVILNPSARQVYQSNPQHNPWSTSFTTSDFVQGYLMGVRLKELFPAADANPKIRVITEADDQSMVNITEGFRRWASQQRNFNRIEYVDANDVTATTSAVAAMAGGGYAALLGLTTDADSCKHIVENVSPASGNLASLEHVFVAYDCAHPNTDWGDLAASSSSRDKILAFLHNGHGDRKRADDSLSDNGRGRIYKSINSEDADDPYQKMVRDSWRARTGLGGQDGMHFFGQGWAQAYTFVEAIRVASQLPGGVNRANFQLALWSLDLYNPMMRRDFGVLELDGPNDPWLIEGGYLYDWDGGGQIWDDRRFIQVDGTAGGCAIRPADNLCTAPVENPFDRSTFTKATSVEDILAEAAHSRAQNVQDLAIAYYEGTAGQVEPGTWQGLNGLTIDTSNCDADDPTWNSKGVTDTQIRLGLSFEKFDGPNFHDDLSFVIGWQDYFNYVNGNDPIFVDGTKRSLVLVNKGHGGNRNTGKANVAVLVNNDNVLGVTIFEERREQGFVTDSEDFLRGKCVPLILSPSAGSVEHSSPQHNPWWTSFHMSDFTQGYLMGVRLKELFPAADANPKIRVITEADDQSMVNIREGFRRWASQHPNFNRIEYVVANDVTATTGAIAAMAGGGYDALLGLTTDGDSCRYIVENVSPASGDLASLEHVFVPYECAHPNTDWGDVATAGSSRDKILAFLPNGDSDRARGTTSVSDTGGGRIYKNIFTADSGDPFQMMVRRRWQRLNQGVTSEDHMHLFSQGWAHAYTFVEAIRIASQLPGSVSRANFQLALWSFDLYNPMLIPGMGDIALDGPSDPWLIEGTNLYDWNSDSERWDNHRLVVADSTPGACGSTPHAHVCNAS